MFRVFLKSKQLGPATKRWMVSYSSASTNRIIQRRCMHKSVIVRKNTNKNINQADDLIKSIEEKQLLEKQKKKDLQQNKHKKTTLWQKIKTEAVHYWHGTKLLGLEVRISSRLIYKLLQGTTLTRRENRQVHYTDAHFLYINISLAAPYHHRYHTSCAFCCICHCSIYGTLVADRIKVISKYAT